VNVDRADSGNLDLLRSFAVLCVLVFHLLLFFGHGRVPHGAGSLGHWGVLVFFVHTSIVLMASIERLQRRADAMTARGAALKRLADTAGPLFQSLDDAQKHRFALLARFMRPHGPHRMMGRERFGGGPGFGGFGGRDGMRGDGFHMRRFGEDHGMRGPYGMGPMHGRGDMSGMGGRDDEEDYRGPL
jgi:hypothetical protein